MNEIRKGSIERLGKDFVQVEFREHPETIPAESERRNRISAREVSYRELTKRERLVLIRNGNTADDWNNLRVAEGFDPEMVHDCEFYGLVRIGALSASYLEFHDLRVPVGLRNATIVSCDFGNDVAVRNVGHISHYLVGDEVILFNTDELVTTSYAKFGNGILRSGENEDVRIQLEICNENGGRGVLPFEGMETADAYLWSRNRSNRRFQKALVRLVDRKFSKSRGWYGTIGARTVVKSCRIIKDVAIGEHAYVKGANKLKNLTIKSRAYASTQIGEGVELVNGIIEYGCRIFYGVKAVRFYMRTNACLKYGARLINSILGDNGTISCCEVLNSLVFAGHEQHHNNSFLCAATVLGQSNIAAGATIGSNHNSRGNDGEAFIGRGFWPGLCVNLKHSSRFASYCLIVKGTYPAELDVPLPFALVSNDTTHDRLLIRPGYWFLHNMYALARNAWKYGARDARLYRWQRYEYDYLAPDTVNEIMHGIEILEVLAGSAASLHGDASNAADVTEIRELGRKQLLSDAVGNELVLRDAGIESSKRPIVILKPSVGYREYREMVRYYAVQMLLEYKERHAIETLEELVDSCGSVRRERWENVGGQLMREQDVRRIIEEISNGALGTWEAVHRRYADLAESYGRHKARHALASLLELEDSLTLTEEIWFGNLRAAAERQRVIRDRTVSSRAKDYTNSFRSMMYETTEEMETIVGRLAENEFIHIIEKQSEDFFKLIEHEISTLDHAVQ